MRVTDEHLIVPPIQGLRQGTIHATFDESINRVQNPNFVLPGFWQRAALSGHLLQNGNFLLNADNWELVGLDALTWAHHHGICQLRQGAYVRQIVSLTAGDYYIHGKCLQSIGNNGAFGLYNVVSGVPVFELLGSPDAERFWQLITVPSDDDYEFAFFFTGGTGNSTVLADFAGLHEGGFSPPFWNEESSGVHLRFGGSMVYQLVDVSGLGIVEFTFHYSDFSTPHPEFLPARDLVSLNVDPFVKLPYDEAGNFFSDMILSVSGGDTYPNGSVTFMLDTTGIDDMYVAFDNSTPDGFIQINSCFMGMPQQVLVWDGVDLKFPVRYKHERVSGDCIVDIDTHYQKYGESYVHQESRTFSIGGA